MKIHHHPHSRGFALVATVSMMVLLTLVAIAMLSLSTIEQRSSGGGANEADRMARANARMALMMALGELQKAAGPDQRVSATASILGSTTNPYATGTTAADGRKHWVGVWDTSSYSPAVPDTKTFLRWLVSGDQDQLDTSLMLAPQLPPMTSSFLKGLMQQAMQIQLLPSRCPRSKSPLLLLATVPTTPTGWRTRGSKST